MNGVALALCGLAFASSWLAGRRSLGLGLAVTLAWGYFYGIVRANVLASASHFIFDCSLLGCYSSLLFQKVDREHLRQSGALPDWVVTIFAWTALVALLPFQTPLITLVGLRGNLFFVPVLLLASRMGPKDLRFVVGAVAFLNIAAFGFGVAEYRNGVERFYPESVVTQIIYRSRDAGGGQLRIPAIFSNAHSYAGSMVSGLPLLLAAAGIAGLSVWLRLFYILGAVAAMFGVLFANTRMYFVVTVLVLVGFLFLAKMRSSLKGALVLVVCAVAAVALSNERFQRFRSLDSTDAFTSRIAGSVNRSFFEVVTEYPLGNGLGGGGTSIPNFLEHQLHRPVSVENEYARIALELGIPGFLIWVAFILWIMVRAFPVSPGDPWRGARRLTWVLVCFGFASSALGTGMLTGIPGTMLTFLWIGWLVTKPALEQTQPLESTEGIETLSTGEPASISGVPSIRSF